MASARVGSGIRACHSTTGTWVTTIVAVRPYRSSRISSKSRAWERESESRSQSSKIRSCIRARRWRTFFQFPDMRFCFEVHQPLPKSVHLARSNARIQPHLPNSPRAFATGPEFLTGRIVIAITRINAPKFPATRSPHRIMNTNEIESAAGYPSGCLVARSRPLPIAQKKTSRPVLGGKTPNRVQSRKLPRDTA